MRQSVSMSKRRTLRVSHDPSVGAVYIGLQPLDVVQPSVVRTESVGASINLDFDGHDRLVGVEVLSASLVHPALLAEADEDSLVPVLKSEQQLEGMVEHVRYELVSLMTFLSIGNAWVEEIEELPDGWGMFAAAGMLESSLVHARCLAEFLRRTDRSSDTITALDYVTGWHWREGETLKDDLAEVHGRVAHLGLIRLSVQRDDRAFRWDDYLRDTAVPTLLRGFRKFLGDVPPQLAERFNQPRSDVTRIDLISEITRLVGR
jgi:uncharacterized protein YuzE